MGKHLSTSKVVAYNKQGQLIKIYKTAKEASLDLNLFPRSVDKAIRQSSLLKDYQWRRYDSDKEIIRKIEPYKNKQSNHKNIEVLMLDDDDNIIKEYPSINLAALDNKIDHKSIRDCINNKQNHAGGYRWRKK